MAEERLTLEPEVQAVLEKIDDKRNFLLSGGAGSGKTYSLVRVIRQVLAENPLSRIACMTYTNAAVQEIEHRVNHKNLHVSTIHDFLWDNIKHFQKELKICLAELANDPEMKLIKIDEEEDITPEFFSNTKEGIQYKEFVRLREGIISHDEVLILANKLFSKFPKISDIIKDKYEYIFVDEYQDTNKSVIEIFLTHFKLSAKQNIVGFFGDAMQAIYDDGIGNLDAYKGDQPDQVAEVQKPQNRRNPQRIINLANLIRTDGLTQEPSTDVKAPNMVEGHIKAGNVKFIYSNNSDFAPVRQYLHDTLGWPVFDPKKTKELNLTHNLIADKGQFRTLMDIYDRDQVLAYKNRIRKYIKDNAIADDFTNHSFGEVVEHLKKGKTGSALNAVKPTAGMQTFIDEHPDLYEKALGYNYLEFSKLYVDKDQLIDDKKQSQEEESRKGSKRDNLIKHLFKIQNNITFYTNKQYNDFLRATDYKDKVLSVEAKRTLKQNIEALVEVGDKTIEHVINEAHELGICLVDERLEKFRTEKRYIYDRVKDVKYKEFQKLYDYLQGHTPFSTQHRTKGSEFNTVLVILDNGNWNSYNFTNLFLNTGTPSVLERTQKIFYVCCTRAMDNLAVFFHAPSPQVIAKAVEWFGEENVVPL